MSVDRNSDQGEDMVVTCFECEMPILTGDTFREEAGKIYHYDCLIERDERLEGEMTAWMGGE